MQWASALLIIPLLPLFGAAFNLLFGRRLGKPVVTLVALGSVMAAFALSLSLVVRGFANQGLTYEAFDWIAAGSLQLKIAFTLDRLSAVMILTVTFVGSLIHVYSVGYMARDERYSTYFAYLNLFTGAMLILVLADSLPVMFIGWEGVGLCSYLLIGFWFTEEANAYAGRKAFVVNRIGDFAFLLGMFAIFWWMGRYDEVEPSLRFADMQAHAGIFRDRWMLGEHAGLFCGLMLFIGACGKSAQIPLYVWLPDAMAGPTPVSALIHAATMVTAGVYMIARLSFLYASSTTLMAIVAVVGVLTALVAAVIAFAQTDFKKVLAYSTVSQLGFMMVAVGVGAYSAGILHLVTHAFFKAGLFLAAGSVMHAMSGSGNILIMGGLRKKLPLTHLSFAVYWLAICGIFPFSGFWSKDEILLGAFVAGGEGWPAWFGEALWFGLSLAAVGTAFYMSRLYYLVFAGECRADAETRAHIHESPLTMTVPLLVLAAFTLVIGVVLGMPHLSFLHSVPHYMADWLAPVTTQGLLGHASDTVTLLLMGLAFALAGAAIYLARMLYRNGPLTGPAIGLRGTIIRTVQNKLYVDEMYDFAVVRPFRALCGLLFAVVDRLLIDGLLVNGPAKLVDLFGRAARWFQNGQVQRYLVVVLVSGAAIFFIAGRPDADFTARPAGGRTVSFEANVGTGPTARGATVAWDFDGDGETDSNQAKVIRAFDTPGTYRVTLTVTEGVFGRTATVTRQIEVNEGGAP